MAADCKPCGVDLGGIERNFYEKKYYLKCTGKYLFRMITLLIAVSVISFVLVSLSPVDPVQQYVGAVPNVSVEQRAKIAEYWGLNDPPVERFFAWAGSVLHGDFGVSLLYRRPVLDIIVEKFGASLALMMTAWIFSGVLGFAIGCVMGLFNGRWMDKILKKICFVMCSIPTFWIGIVFLMVFSVMLGWFPFGMSVPKGVPADEVTILQRIHHLVLPALTLSFLSFANVALHTRENAGGCVRERLCIVCESKRRVEVECVKTTWTAQYSASRSNDAVWLL